MENKVEKNYEERLASLKKGCIVLGVLLAISFVWGILGLKQGGSLISVIISGVLSAMTYFIYRYTKERNPLGPKLEKIFGFILLLDGILLCLSIVGVLFGVIYIILSFGIFKEAKYFKEEIGNAK